MLPFNISYSCWSLYKERQLQFYFQYVKNFKPTDESFSVYGIVGNVIHDSIEHYVRTGKKDRFDPLWESKDIEHMETINDKVLSRSRFKQMFEMACVIVDELKEQGLNVEPEIRVEYIAFNEHFKSFIDLAVDGKEFWDWKSNSTHSYEMHRDQRLFYSWICWSRYGFIPTCKWVYLAHKDKKGKPIIHQDRFTEEEMKDFDLQMELFVTEVVAKGNDINQYISHGWKHIFNKYLSLCRDEVARREATPRDLDIKFIIKGNFIFIEGEIPAILLKAIDHQNRFDLPDKYYRQQAVKKRRGGIINLEDIGTVHLFNMRYRCFPIGLMRKISKLCEDYGKAKKIKVSIEVIDHRNPLVMKYVMKGLPDRLLSGKVLRPYQEEGKDIFLKKKSGIIHIFTGGGKTLLATEIIRQLSTRTLWIIDRKELLEQTKEAIEQELGIEMGIIYDGKVDIKDITISTIQSLNSKLSELTSYLTSVNFVVVDEYHKSAADTYQKVFSKLANTSYRLGLTGTPFRDDGKTPILFSILDEIIYKRDSKWGIDNGFIVNPNINFIDVTASADCDDHMSHQEDYELNISENIYRNNLIISIANQHKNDKVLILTKLVKHGKELAKALDCQHIHGKVGKKLRPQIMAAFRASESSTVVMTSSIGSTGLDVPDLDVIINASANKGDVMSIQIIGRVLRIADGKKEAYYYDFIDGGKYTEGHSERRIREFERQGFQVTRCS